MCLIDVIGASACPMVVFSDFYESLGPPPSGDARGIVQAHRHGHPNGQQSGHILHLCFVCCCPGGCRDDTERVFPRWWRPVASGIDLDMLHLAMPSIFCMAMAIEMACDRGTFVHCRRLFCLIKT